MTAPDVVIIGAGQAGLSISRCLSRDGVEHVVLDQGRVAESWRSARWDAFCLVTPNWSIRLAGQDYDGDDPNGFLPRDELLALVERYAEKFGAPVRCGQEVERVIPRSAGGFEVRTRQGLQLFSRIVVVATGTHRLPRFPAVLPSAGQPDDASHLAAWSSGRVAHLHVAQYRNPTQLPTGGVLVVGSAQSGCQIADELNRAGREVVLSTGRTGRLPRRYRGRDIIEWQQRMGFLDRPASALEHPAHRFRADPHLSGHDGGRTLDLRSLNQAGIRLAGRLTTLNGELAQFDDQLPNNLSFADSFATRVVREIDEFILQERMDAPPACDTNSDVGFKGERFIPDSPRRLDLGAEGIASVVWATGFRHDFGWVRAPVFDDYGYPAQTAGRTAVPGLHFLGLNYVDQRKSGILYGVGEDAERLARIIRKDLGHG